LLAVLCSLAPSLALAAPSPVPVSQVAAPVWAGVANSEGMAIAGALTADSIEVAGPDGTTVSGLRVHSRSLESSGDTDFFTVLCRQWESTPSAGAVQGSWYYSESSAPAGSGPDVSQKAAGLARSIPMVGHACAVTKDPTPANIARLAFDVVTVIVFVQLVMHVAPEISGVAIALNHAPGALAGIQILLQHGPGIIATVKASMAVIDRLNAAGDQMQARLKQGAQAQVTSPQDLQEAVGPALETVAGVPGMEGVARAQVLVPLLPGALAGGQAAVAAGAQWAGQNGPAISRQLAQGAGWAGRQASANLAGLGHACLRLPFLQVGCSPG
jgi:hypothetical protein